MGKKKEANPVGRPNLNLDVPYQIRMTEEDRSRWSDCAAEAGMSLAQWIRFNCSRLAGAKSKPVSVEFVTSYPARPEK